MSKLLLTLLIGACLIFLAFGQILPTGAKLALILKGNLLLVTPNDPNSGQLFNLRSSITANIQGIDYRPANGLLYVVTSANQFWSVNSTTGVATLVSTMDNPFNGGADYGFDFNPVVDRIRIVGSNGINARYNIDTGALADFNLDVAGIQYDQSLTYASQAGTPFVVGAAYTNSFNPAPNTTVLYVLDRETNSLYTQSPPNNGVLNLVGSTNVKLGKFGAFDIYTNPSTGVSTAIYGSNKKKYYSINLSTGAATQIWLNKPVLKRASVVGFTIIPPL
jgi:hypothetical protein